MIIQHNIPAWNSHRQLGLNNAATAKNLEKLSSGYRINRAGDDAAGLAISEKMRGQIRGLAMAEMNVANGISLIQTSEGGLQETHAILQRMRELAVQSANGTYDNDVDRYNLNKEVDALKSEIDRIATSTHYNGINLLDGLMGGERMQDFVDAGIKAGTYTNDATGKAAAITKFLEDNLGTDVSATVVKLGANYTDFDKQTATITRNDAGNLILQLGDKSYKYYATVGIANGTSGFYEEGTDFTTSATTAKAGQVLEVDLDTANGATGTAKKGMVISFKVTSATAGIAFNAMGNDLKAATEKTELVFQIGANGYADQRVGLHVENMSTGNLGTASVWNGTTRVTAGDKILDISIATQEDARKAIDVINNAINQVSSTRADMGALQNRLEHTSKNLGVTKENLQAAESVIRDVDMAKEMMEFQKNQILVQASQAMLAQANALPQGVLQLLR